MAKNFDFSVEATLSSAEARRFMLWQQCLLPPRRLEGKAGAFEYVRRAGCIQYDPVNVVGPSPHLTLQARVRDYRSAWLDELLYQDRALWDGFDKVQSIFPAEDYPYFSRRREASRANHRLPQQDVLRIQPQVLAMIRERGALCSLDLQAETQVNGLWGVAMRVERAALENLYQMGEIGIHHRVGTRRYFDLVERLLPADLLARGDPFASREDYHDWHALRRIGSMGLAHPGSGEAWLGILGMKSSERLAALGRLRKAGKIIALGVAEAAGRVFFARRADWQAWQAAGSFTASPPAAALLPPLDNLLWQRDLLRWLFGFEYIWEVYKKPEQRAYGAYTLPVLYREGFIARCDPLLERKRKTLRLRGWWWQAGAQMDDEALAALGECLAAFSRSLGAEQIELAGNCATDPILNQALRRA
ncbi:MAG: crosslink repair DNA glycosylase YcaQ family protein [Bellilinea sp.]|jgi:uncharacterized protein YcaQ